MAHVMQCITIVRQHFNRGGIMKKRHRITLRNDFHNTEITVLSEYDNPSDTWHHIQENLHTYNAADAPTAAEKARYRRIKNALCGSADCRCGTVR